MTAGEATREYYREQGRQQEQDRIIKLLESQIDYGCPECLDRAANDGIALIKGEK